MEPEQPQGCQAGRVGDRVVLGLPADPGYNDILARLVESAAELAGLGPHAAGRARLLALEVFAHVAGQCSAASDRGDISLELVVEPDGLRLCFTSDHLAFDPQAAPAYSLGEVLEGRPPEGLGLQLMRRYATQVTLTRSGPTRRLCLTLPRGAGDQGSRPWHRLIPTLAPGLTLTPVERDGRLRHRLDDARTGRSYLARRVAHHVLSLIDGQASFGRIMAQTLKVMPEAGLHTVEDLFEVLVSRDLVTLVERPLNDEDLVVRDQTASLTHQALKAYKKQKKD